MSRICLVSAVTLSAVVLTACGSSSEPEPAAPSSTPSTTAQPTTTAAQSQATVYTLPGSGVFPEGITADDNTFYVTSTADGAVFRGTVGTPDVAPFLAGGQDGRTGAAGLDVEDNRLVIAGGATGTVWIYDTQSGQLTGRFSNGLGADATFLNDVVISDDGDAYITDSRSPNLYRIPESRVDGNNPAQAPLESFVDFTGSPFVYGEGFNANGIVEADDDALVVVQSSTGNLYRVDEESRAVTAVDLGGANVQNGDGMETDDDTLYVVRNRDGLITTIDLSDDGTSGRVTGEITDPSFAYPTTVASVDDRLLVVNSQFDKRGGTPVEPFTVSGVRKN
ncbi:hypothetical protein GCM10007304_10640 [Rhodococcoides trifolii]|uniref:Superoxide dismutase n=1 Tax=Rhodococcoides trifolii TaxID=908250 RepID=A0A917FSK4_9NOCA|nr:superoxide dismutase [Rhodococcus trifolii]GGF98479.1 hypothetical protein GCM10007304_10640 [Rhodococcus trifolii]